MTTRRSRRSERGAVAILTAAMALLLFATGAFAVDIGNAVTRKRATVGSADMAALAGAAGLPATSTPTLQLVADYLNQNQPLNDGTSKSCNPDAGKPIVTSMLTDSNNANGEVTFPKDNQIHVTTPNVLVSFGMAGALGFHQVCVGSQATARIASGSLGMAP